MNRTIKCIKNFFTTIGILVVFGTLTVTGYKVYDTFFKDEDKAITEPYTVSTVLDIDAIISEIGELNACQSDYTLSHRYDKSTKLWGHTVPLTSNYVTIKYSGVVKAGIDLNKLRIKSTEKYVSIKLPEAEIFSNELKTDSFEVLDEKKNIFNHINVEEFNLCYDTMKKEGESKAIREGILDEAKSNAENHIRFMLEDICEKHNIELIIE